MESVQLCYKKSLEIPKGQSEAVWFLILDIPKSMGIKHFVLSGIVISSNRFSGFFSPSLHAISIGRKCQWSAQFRKIVIMAKIPKYNDLQNIHTKLKIIQNIEQWPRRLLLTHFGCPHRSVLSKGMFPKITKSGNDKLKYICRRN
jgi:hypothetical protein